LRFAKAEGLGNDFLLVEWSVAPAPTAAWIQRLCDRHLGIGADGVIVYAVEGNGVAMRLYNADGEEAEISGNGVRCLAAHVVRKRWLPPAHTVRTAAGVRAVDVTLVEGSRYRVATDLGRPILESREIPVGLEPPATTVIDHALEAAGQTLRITATSLGNPHCAVFLDEVVSDSALTLLGPALERHAFFPRRTNVEFVTIAGPNELRVRFWERGVGYTRASGTGAASAAVAAVIARGSARHVRVVCDGGVLEVDWPERGSVRQVGEAEVLFEGDWLPSS
jgi:diaminopimelate epimerase